jgi:hypothetical protein
VTLTRYATFVTGAVAIPLAVLGVTWGSTDPHAMRSVAFGGAVAAVNAIAAYATVLWSRERSTNVFLGAVLGGTLGRMAAMLAAAAVGLGLLDLRRVPMVAALLSYYVLFLIFEMKLLARRPVGAAS